MGSKGHGRGLFVTLEGSDGAGKSSQATLLADALRETGHQVTLTREPGGTPLGERIRRILLDSEDLDSEDLVRSPASDAFLFNAARSQLVRDVIAPALERDEVVICDRFAASTLAYQGHGSGLDLSMLRALERAATGGLSPDLVILIDVPPPLGLARRAGGAAEDVTRFERDGSHDIRFHERVRDGYRKLARSDPARWRVIDGTRSREEIARQIRETVEDHLSRSEPGTGLLRMRG